MKLGYIGLGKMGYNMVELLLDKKYEVVVYNKTLEKVHAIARRGAQPANSIQELITALPLPRLVWIMVPHAAVDDVLVELLPLMAGGDSIIDGGNSPYKDTMRRARLLDSKGIGFLDAGTSGGPEGARHGACMMIGGPEEVFKRYEPLFRDLTVEKGYAYLGPSGSGHFVKMVHNGIEYGMMQSLAEGFAVMKASPFGLDLLKVAEVYNHGSVIESRLIGWLKRAYEANGAGLDGISGAIAHTGEGMWTVEAARELGVPAAVIKASFDFRIESQNKPSYTGKIVSALRHEFGGHDYKELPRKQKK